MPPDAAGNFAAAHRQLVSDTSIQFDMPRFVPPEMPAWLRWLLDLLFTPVRWFFQLLGTSVAHILFYAVIAVVVVFVLYVLVRRLRDGGWPWRRRKESADTDDWRPEEDQARALLSEADALAAQGRYDEAVHLLLFRSIEEIDSRRPDLVRPALTSRDIANASAIPTEPRSAFSSIVMMVEKSLFGGRRLGEGEWRDCRSAYESFAFAGAWR